MICVIERTPTDPLMLSQSYKLIALKENIPNYLSPKEMLVFPLNSEQLFQLYHQQVLWGLSQRVK